MDSLYRFSEDFIFKTVRMTTDEVLERATFDYSPNRYLKPLAEVIKGEGNNDSIGPNYDITIMSYSNAHSINYTIRAKSKVMTTRFNFKIDDTTYSGNADILYINGLFIILVDGSNLSNRAYSHKQSLIFSILDGITLSSLRDRFDRCKTSPNKDPKDFNLPAGELYSKLNSFVNGSLVRTIPESTSERHEMLRELMKLIPKSYRQFRIEGRYIVGVTNICNIRYQGSTYSFGPFDVYVPFLWDKNISKVTDDIKVSLHDFTKSGLVNKDKVVLADKGYIFPHVHSFSKHDNMFTKAMRCCLGNYESMLTEDLESGDIKSVFTKMFIYLNSITNDWYCNMDQFKEYSNLSKYTDGLNGLNSYDIIKKGNGFRPIRDYKVTKLIDYYCEVHNYPQPTEEAPVPWKDTKGIPKDFYITPFTADEFDEDGYDPHGYDENGENRYGRRWNEPLEAHESVEGSTRIPGNFIYEGDGTSITSDGTITVNTYQDPSYGDVSIDFGATNEEDSEDGIEDGIEDGSEDISGNDIAQRYHTYTYVNPNASDTSLGLAPPDWTLTSGTDSEFGMIDWSQLTVEPHNSFPVSNGEENNSEEDNSSEGEDNED